MTDGGHVDEAVLAYSNGSGRQRSLVALPRPVRVDDRADPPLGAVRGQGARRLEADGPPVAGRGPRAAERSGGVRRVPRRPDRPRVPPLVPRDLGARPGGLARRLRRPTSSGSSARSATASPASGPGSPARLGGARRAVARRGDARAPARAGPRAAAGGLRRRPDGRGHRRAWRRRTSSTSWSAGSRRSCAAIAEATGVTGDPAAIAAGSGRARSAPSSGWRRRRGTPDGAAAGAAATVTRRGRRGRAADPPPMRRPVDRAGLDRRDRAALLAWLALSQIGELARAPTWPRHEPAWYDELRLPGALVAGLRRRRASTRARRGRSPTASGSCSPCRARRRSAGPSATAPTRRLSTRGWRSRRSGSRSASTRWEGVEYLDRDRFDGLLGWAVRLDAIDVRDARRAAASSAVDGSACPRPPRPPATGSIACGRPRRAPAGRRSAEAKPKPAPKRTSAPRPRVGRLSRSRIRRSSDVGGVPWAMTDSRCGPVDEAGRLAEAADDARLRARPPRRAGRPTRPPPGGAPRARCPTSRASPRSTSTAGSMTAAPGRTWRAPRPAPGSRRRPSARRPRPRSSRRSGCFASMIALVTERR